MLRITLLLVAIFLGASLVNSATADVVSDQVLKTFFETGDKPANAQITTLIDSELSISLLRGDTNDAHTVRIVDGRIALDATGEIRAFTEGERIDDRFLFSGIGESVEISPLADPMQRYMGMQFDDVRGDSYFGFLQLQVEPGTSPDPYAIHLHHFVYETNPATGITTFSQPIPEPTTASLFAAVVALLAAIFRRNRVKRGHGQLQEAN
jgi:hypothetical protein